MRAESLRILNKTFMPARAYDFTEILKRLHMVAVGPMEKPVRARRFRMAEIETALSRAGTSLCPWRHRTSLRRDRPYRRRAEPLSSGSSHESPSLPETHWPRRLC